LLGGYLSDKVFGARRMPVAVIGLVVVAVVLLGFNALPATKLALGSAFFFIGFFLYMPDSLVAGTAALDFGTRKGAGTAAGMINGFGSIGAIVGVTLPGILSGMLSEGADIWYYIFPGLGVSLVIAAVLLLPKWNALPATEKTA
jgi:sugar phosphate permease